MKSFKNFKIAQISDTHLLKNKNEQIYNINPYNRLRNIINEVQKSSYEIIFLTGDIADKGNIESYYQLSELIKPIKCKMVLIPGNHDLISTMEKAISPSDKILIAPQDPIVIGNWSFIYLDSVIENETYGQITTQTIERIKHLISTINTDHIVIFTHHHPYTIGSSIVDKHKMINFASIESLLSHKVKLLMHGHVHMDYTMYRQNITYTSAPSTGFQFTFGGNIDTNSYGFKEYFFYDEYFLSTCRWFFGESNVS